MGNEWKIVTLNDVVDILGDGLHGTPKYNPIGEYYFINGNNLTNGKIEFNKNIKRVDKTEYEKYKKHLNARTILVSINGTIGNVAVYDNEKIILGKSACYFNVKIDTDKYFVKYLVSSPLFNNYINTYATGTTIKNVSLKSMREFKFKLPSLKAQITIAQILCSLDNKIDLNRQMNQTLEQMAQALYNSWFVDFDPVIDNALEAGNTIPGELSIRATKRKELGEFRKPLPDSIKNLFPSEFEFCDALDRWIPKGWELQTLDENIQLIGGGTPKTTVEEYWNGDIPWFSVVDAPNNSDVFVVDTEKKITNQGLQKSSTKLLRKGTTIITARGTVGKCALVGISMAMNQSCYGINSTQDGTDIYTYYVIRESVSALQLRGHGSVFNTITRDTFKSIRIPVSSINLRKEFDILTSPYLNRIKQNLFQTQILIIIRDALLPKLISGELQVSDKVLA
jgi:type I restriction enzyme S subunit